MRVLLACLLLIAPAGLIAAEVQTPPEQGATPGTIALDPFVVNIADRDRDRYLKLKAELEVTDPQVRAELDFRTAQIRDLVISLLGSKSFDEIRSIEGKNFLREELLLRMNAVLMRGRIHRIYFTEFIVQ